MQKQLIQRFQCLHDLSSLNGRFCLNFTWKTRNAQASSLLLLLPMNSRGNVYTAGSIVKVNRNVQVFLTRGGRMKRRRGRRKANCRMRLGQSQSHSWVSLRDVCKSLVKGHVVNYMSSHGPRTGLCATRVLFRHWKQSFLPEENVEQS